MLLQTERLQLREFTLKDSDFLIALLNTEGWLKFIGDRNVKNTAQAEAYLKERIIKSYKDSGFGFYLVSLKDETPIGMCGLVKRDFLKHVDIGFALLPQFEGLGYAFEASKAIINYAKNHLKLNHLQAIVNENNSNSINLLNKLGLSYQEKIWINDQQVLLFSSTSEI